MWYTDPEKNLRLKSNFLGIFNTGWPLVRENLEIREKSGDSLFVRDNDWWYGMKNEQKSLFYERAKFKQASGKKSRVYSTCIQQTAMEAGALEL